MEGWGEMRERAPSETRLPAIVYIVHIYIT